MLYSSLRHTLLVPLLLVGSLLVVTACDSGGSTGSSTELSGTVTDDGSATTSAKSKAAVDGATVTAVRLNDDGSTTALDASATTDSDGAFTLTVDRQSDGATLIVKAEKDGENFSSSVGVQVTDPSATEAQPMTPETDAEAQVTMDLAANSDDQASEALADAAVLVDNEVANAILSGNTSPQDIADVARSMDETKEQYAGDAGTSVNEDNVAENEQEAYETLQTALAKGANQSEALKNFEEAMASSYEDAGASADLQAEIQQTGTKVALSALDNVSLPDAAERGLKRRTTVLQAISVGTSVEQTIGNNGDGNAGTARGDLEEARSTLLANIRDASTDIDDEVSKYRDKIKSNVAEGFSSADVDNGFDNNGLNTAVTELEGALDTAISTTDGLDVNAGQVSTAFDTFYSNGRSAVQTVYEGGGMSSGPANAAAKATVKAKAF